MSGHLFGAFGIIVWFFVWLSWSWGSKRCLVWCPLGPAPVFALVFVVLSFFSFVMGMFAGDAFLSVFLSLSGAGETQTPFGVWVSPCDSSSWTRSAMTTRSSCSAPLTRSGSRTCFFFFFFRRRRSLVWWWLVLVCLFSVWPGWFLLAVSFFCGGVLLCALRARCCLGRFRRGRETRHLPLHFLIAIMIVFRGLRVGTDIPCVAQRGSTPIRSHPPPPPSCRTL